MTSENPFFVELAKAAADEAAKHAFTVELVSGDKKAENQARQVQDFIAKKVHAILLTPCNAQLVGAPIKEANKAGIPVFTADTGCLDASAKVVSHVATDNYSGGKQAAFMLADFAEVVMVAGLVTALFFGGWQVPWLGSAGWGIVVVW